MREGLFARTVAKRNEGIVKVLVLGGTGVISREIVPDLVDRHDDVTIFNRGNHPSPSAPHTVEHLRVDARERGTLGERLGRRQYDVVIDMAIYSSRCRISNRGFQ